MARDILKTLTTEHQTVRALFEEMNATTDRAKKTRASLLERIETSLLSHAKWEEQVFYPEFKKRADRDGLQTHAEAVEEHRAVEQTVMPDVHAADVETPEFAGRVKVFAEMVDHHAKEEEKTMFKMARELFSTEERARLDEEYEAWKHSGAAASVMADAKAKTGLKGAATAPIR
ncbi:MAG TPA: hemerythrin domain-containing protein [Lysobacter sp.]|jgi:hemerythrin-like domain-containing protein|nr:hemerythrin domain-containing protein [Lysobacter sp.]